MHSSAARDLAAAPAPAQDATWRPSARTVAGWLTAPPLSRPQRLASQGKRSLWSLYGVFRPTPEQRRRQFLASPSSAGSH